MEETRPPDPVRHRPLTEGESDARAADLWTADPNEVQMPIRDETASRAFAPAIVMDSRPATKRNSTLLLAFVGLTVLLSSCAIWYWVASRNIQRQIRRFQTHYATVEQAQNTCFQATGEPLDTIRFDDLSRYMTTLDAERGAMLDAMGRLTRGDGMAFWAPKRRRTAAAEMNTLLERQTALAAAAKAALDAETANHAELVGTIADTRARREAAAAALAPETDEDRFASLISSLRSGSKRLNKTAAMLTKARDARDTAALPERIRRSLSAGMLRDLSAEERLLEHRTASTAHALNLLRQYKRALLTELRKTSGLVFMIDKISTTIQPAVEFAFTKTTPLREFMHDITKPIPGGRTRGFLSGLFGRSQRSEPQTVLSIASSIDPRVRFVGDILVQTCNAIETAHREVGSVVSSISPASSAMKAFAESGNRSDMLRLVHSAPPAAAMLQSHVGLFDPAIARLESLRPYATTLHQVASQTRIPFVGDVFQRAGHAVDQLIDAAQIPFQSARQTISSAAASLASIQTLEASYRGSLDALKSNTASVPSNASTTFSAMTTLSQKPPERHDIISATLIAGSNQTVTAGSTRVTFEWSGWGWDVGAAANGTTCDFYDAPHGVGSNFIEQSHWPSGETRSFPSRDASDQSCPSRVTVTVLAYAQNEVRVSVSAQ